jgi:ankyrin repeat protein
MLVLAHCFVDINAASEANPVLPVHFSALNGHVDSLFLLNQYAATLIQTTRCLSPADFKNLMLDQSLIKRIKDRKLYLNRAAPATFAALAGHAEVLLLLACLCIDLNSNTCDKPSYVLTTSAPSKIRAYSYSEAQCLVVLIRSQALELENASARLRSRGDEELSRLEDGHAWATPFVSQTTYTVKLRVDMQDADGNTALHDAAKEGAVNQVAWLITQGANVNMQNNQGYTPIQVAAFYHELGALTCLLFMPGKFTPNLELQDGVNDTAVTFAVYDKTQDNPDCLSLLLEMKANPNPKNKKGITPLAYAAAHSSSPLFDALLSSGAVDLFGCVCLSQ